MTGMALLALREAGVPAADPLRPARRRLALEEPAPRLRAAGGPAP